MSNTKYDNVTTAVLLAAGTGSRLQPLTDNAPKCLSEINGVSILQRLVDCLCSNGFQRLIVVVGYLDHRIREFFDDYANDLTIDYVINSRYATTNNIYSLWLARAVIGEPFLLVESDVVFDATLLKDMLQPNKIAISSNQTWMNGTTVTVDLLQRVLEYQMDSAEVSGKVLHKTVNIYSFTKASWDCVASRLSQYVIAGRVNEYYELVLAEMIADGSLALDAVAFDGGRWCEVDTLADLREAELMFPESALQ
jgi:choline kinase